MRRARVVAWTDCVVLRFRAEDLKQCLKKSPSALEWAMSCATSDLEHHTFLVQSLQKDTELFGKVPLNFLNSICRTVDIVSEFGSFEWVFQEGSGSRGLCVVRAGSVNVVHSHPNGQQQFLKALKVGDYFGEMSLILPERSASIIAGAEGCTLLFLNFFKVQQLFEAVPALRVLLENRVAEMRSRNNLLRGVSSENVSNFLFRSNDSFHIEK